MPLIKRGLAMLRDLLGKIPFFTDLPETLLMELAIAARERQVEKGELVLLKGDRPTGMYAVLDGIVKLACQTASGEERAIALLGNGEVFGESAIILGNSSPYMATALTRAHLLHIDADAVLAASARSALFAKRLIVKLSSNMDAHMRDLEAFLLHPPLKRLANYLVSQPIATAGNSQVICLQVPKHVIASRLGMTPEALSRSLRALSDVGAIAIGADHVCVIDDSLLYEIAQQP